MSFFTCKNKSRLLFSFFLLCALACSPKESQKDTLFVILDSKPSSLDPRKTTSANGMRLVDLIFNGLVKLDDRGELAPDLAWKWELKGLTWTFYLKPHLRFSNGRPVSQEDILFSFEEFQKPNSPFYSSFKNIQSVRAFRSKLKEGLRETAYPPSHKPAFRPKLKEGLRETLNQKTVKDQSGESPSLSSQNNKNHLSGWAGQAFKQGQPQAASPQKKQDEIKSHFIIKITLKKFQAPFLYSDLPVIKILPKKEILKSPTEFQKKPLGSGMFTVEKNDFREILLKRQTPPQAFSPRYLSFQIVRDSATRAQKMLSQEADIAPSVLPAQKISKFKKQSKHFRVLSRPGLSTAYLLINFKNKLLQNKKLRQALSLSLHREEIIKYKLYGYALPAQSFISPGNYFFNKNLAVPAFNLQKAKQIIKALNLEGARLELSSSNNPDTVNKVRVLASQISQSGLKISIKSAEWGAFYKDVGQGAYEIAFMKWVGVKDPDIYRVAFHSQNEAPKGRNRSFYKNKKLDRLLSEGRKTRDKAQRKQIYNQIQSLVAKDFVVIPLWHNMDISVLKRSIENYNMRFNGDFLSLPSVKKKPPVKNL